MRYKALVISGKGRGKRIGFPTINMEIPDGLGATHGIYAGWLYVEQKRYPAAVHYGPVPTFHELAPTLEAYVLDATLPQVPCEVELELVTHIRDVKTFLGSEELAVQIASDVEEVREILKSHKL